MRVLLILGLLARTAWSFDTAFWVWHRTTPLSDSEFSELRAMKVRELFWHVGELENPDGAWHWKILTNLPPSPPEIKVVPVVRLGSTVREPFDENGTRSLLAQLARFPGAELQLDMDCPDRLLAEYAQVLNQIHERVPRLSATALAGWSERPEFAALQASVSELLPMFYDLVQDTAGAEPLPLLDAKKVGAALHTWGACKIPWRAGLPNFARVTSYDRSGISRGHLRNFLWSDLCFDRALATLSSSLGVTRFHVDAETRIASAVLAKDTLLTARWPDRAALATAVSDAHMARAEGVIFFRLPDETEASGWSLRQLAHLDARAELVLKNTGATQFTLFNNSLADLAPRLSGNDSRDRGYALELDAPAAIFREATAGDFWRVTAHVDPETKPRPVAVPLATRLTFWFSHLRAGDARRSGLFQLAPGASLEQIRYRILHCEKNAQWKQIE